MSARRCTECGAELELRSDRCPLCGTEADVRSEPELKPTVARVGDVDGYQRDVRDLRDELRRLRENAEAV